jgi:hypothetical protein
MKRRTQVPELGWRVAGAAAGLKEVSAHLEQVTRSPLQQVE